MKIKTKNILLKVFYKIIYIIICVLATVLLLLYGSMAVK